MRLLLAVGVLFVASLAAAQDIQYDLAHSWMSFSRHGESLRIPCITNRSLAQQNPEITRIVVCVHGTLRNANEYHASMLNALGLAGTEGDSTLVVTPQLLTNADTQHHHLSDALCWEYYGWRRGDFSVSGYGGARPWNLSSFALVDSLFLRAADACPNLRDIVLTGHSAGGQVTNRWSASSTVPDLLREERGARFRGVIANPSSYVYFSPERLLYGTSNVFVVPHPDNIALCPTYDDYKYGLQNPNQYFYQSADSLRARYARRHMVHLVGELDNDPDGDYLDQTCAADMQGNVRLDRCQTYWRYLAWSFGADLDPRQAMAVVPGAGHWYFEMFESPCGIYHLFDVGECDGFLMAAGAPHPTYLASPYPNPFNPVVTIEFATPGDGPVDLTVFDPRGRRIRTLTAGTLPGGPHRVQWHGTDDSDRSMSSGVYWVRLRTAGTQEMRSVTLVR